MYLKIPRSKGAVGMAIRIEIGYGDDQLLDVAHAVH